MTREKRKPPGGRRRLSRNARERNLHRFSSTRNHPAQTRPRGIGEILPDRLRRLHHLRRSLDQWRVAGRVGRLPQPSDFGLRLPPLHSREVLWRMEDRP